MGKDASCGDTDRNDLHEQPRKERAANILRGLNGFIGIVEVKTENIEHGITQAIWDAKSWRISIKLIGSCLMKYPPTRGVRRLEKQFIPVF